MDIKHARFAEDLIDEAPSVISSQVHFDASHSLLMLISD